MYILATILTVVTIPVIVISQQCGPLDHEPHKTIVLDDDDLVVLAVIADTTQKHCYRSCCSMLETDGCNTVVYEKGTQLCTLANCEDGGCFLISDDNSATTTIGIYNETTTTSVPTTKLSSNTERTSTTMSKTSMNIDTTDTSLPVSTSNNENIDRNEVATIESSSKTTSAHLSNQLITTTSAVMETAESPPDITPPGPPLDETEDFLNQTEVTVSSEEQTSTDNAITKQEATTEGQLTAISQPSQANTTSPKSDNVTFENNVTVSSTNINNITSSLSVVETSPIPSNTNESLNTATMMTSYNNTSNDTNSNNESTIATTLSNFNSVGSFDEGKLLNITTSTIMTSELNQTFSSNETSQKVTEIVSYNISTTPTINETRQPFISNHTSTVITTTSNNHSEDSLVSPLNSTLFEPKKHHFLSPDDQLPALLVAALSVGIVFIFVVFVLLGKRVFDSWQRRHYSRVDYLINGMYN